MKKVEFISLLGGLLLLSMFFGSCKDDYQSVPTPKDQVHTIHLDLTATVVKQIDAVGSNQRGFTLDVNHSGNSKTESIKWDSDTWDNITNRPQLIAVVYKKGVIGLNNVIKLGQDDYDYNPGHGNHPSQVSIHANLSITGSADKIAFFLMDKSQKTDLQARLGTIKFNSRPGLYDISTGHPVLQKRLDYNVFVHPNDRIFFDFIFRGEIDLSSYNSTGVKNFDMKPFGSLLMVDFASRYDNDVLDNPTAVGDFTPILKTNAFDLIGKIDFVLGGATSYNRDSYTEEIKFEDYPSIGTSTAPIRSQIKTISKTSFSDIYVKYVLPRNSKPNFTEITNGNIVVYHTAGVTQYFDSFNTKKLGITLSMTSGSIISKKKTIDPLVLKYNPLYYVSEYNVASNKESFNKNNSNDDNALVNWSDAKGLFSKSFLHGYHLPNYGEWSAVLPGSVYFYSKTYSNPVTDEGDNLQIGKAVLTNVQSAYKNIYENESSNYVTYAIRYISATMVKDENGNNPTGDTNLEKGNCPYLSVWRYAYIDNPNSDGKALDVYCYVLPKTYKVDYTTDNELRYFDGSKWIEFTTKHFFEERKYSGAVHRVFPVTDLRDTNAAGKGFYWSATPKNSSNVYIMDFDNDRAHSYGYDISTKLFAVRPFIDATQQ